MSKKPTICEYLAFGGILGILGGVVWMFRGGGDAALWVVTIGSFLFLVFTPDHPAYQREKGPYSVKPVRPLTPVGLFALLVIGVFACGKSWGVAAAFCWAIIGFSLWSDVILTWSHNRLLQVAKVMPWDHKPSYWDRN